MSYETTYTNYIPDMTERFPEGMYETDNREEPTEEEQEEQNRQREEYNRHLDNIAVPPSQFAQEFKQKYENINKTTTDVYESLKMHYQIKMEYLNDIAKKYNLTLENKKWASETNSRFCISVDVSDTYRINTYGYGIDDVDVLLQVMADLNIEYDTYINHRTVDKNNYHGVNLSHNGQFQEHYLKDWLKDEITLNGGNNIKQTLKNQPAKQQEIER